MTPEILAGLVAAREAGRAVVLATRLPDGAQHLLPDESAAPGLLAAGANALAEDQSRMVEIAGETWFLHVHAPPPRLLIVGAVHIAQSLAPMATAAGFAVTILDPRTGFATEARFPGTALNHAWPDEAVAALAPDARTAIVTLSHDPKLDDPALDRGLRTEAFFVGALGSRKTHAARLQRLASLGHGAASLARVRGPVGLAIGAVTAPEIAVSILAELIAARRKAPMDAA
ncbi:MAG: XdhC family protein [Rhodospirillales bacterium]